MVSLKSNSSSFLVIKALYFMQFAAFAAFTTYLYVYLKDNGHLTGFQVGVLASVQQFIIMLFLPLWGVLADKYGKKKIYLISLAVSLLFLQGFMMNGSFLCYLLFVILFYAASNPLASLLDTIALEMSDNGGNVVSYGELRLWASIGWALSSAATGYFVRPEFMVLIFPIASFFLLVTWLFGLFYYKPVTAVHSHDAPSLRSIKDLLGGNKRLMVFMILILVFYILNAPIMLFINMYYNEIGGTNMHIGIAFAVQSIFELPFFFWGKKLVGMFGAKRLIVFTMAVAAVRMVLYGVTSNPWVAIAIGASHGVTLGLFMVAVIAYAHSMIPSHLRSTGQSLIYTFLGLGTCFGNFLIGYLKDAISMKSAMTLNGLFIVLLVVVSVLFLYIKKYKNTPRV